ncbi:hypothetical protein [Gandjariella thermophila]|uniref:DUF4145 domain-containing protein n=1 Tax=Gandjariella thermophila TaxID=1931992 RepID=A0A4D4JED5_9PSEU|nr:hypothetical protein [Gandjariella thermophila]GDY33400.1 hypothetical protein GTS_50330 [Gandjariella thermophila]
MFPLDPKTIERVARLACDLDGPLERRGHELEALLRGAGWDDPPEYDGSPRIPWLVDALTERGDQRADIERFLCRVCDPLEYDGGMPVAEEVRQELNRILEPERLAVSYVGGRPVLGEVRLDAEGPVFVAPDNLGHRLPRIVADEQVVSLLLDRIAQSRASEESGAYLLALFGIGSFVEGLLFSVLTEREPELLRSGFRGRDGRRIDARRAGLELLIDTAHHRGLIQLDAKSFMDPVRNFRNFIHPRAQLESAFVPDRDTVTLCWGPVHAVLNDLEESLARSAS